MIGLKSIWSLLLYVCIFNVIIFILIGRTAKKFKIDDFFWKPFKYYTKIQRTMELILLVIYIILIGAIWYTTKKSPPFIFFLYPGTLYLYQGFMNWKYERASKIYIPYLCLSLLMFMNFFILTFFRELRSPFNMM